ncbi:MAG: hypothetical protein M3065_19305 [Actinomycetota bacterium]|nr:hypothetical protein [Actinomycetota bacterium]
MAFSESIDEELVAYDRDNQTAHALSASAAGVAGLCDRQRSPEQIAGELHLDLMIVLQALDEFDRGGLLVEDKREGMSRRAALRRIARVGGAALVAAPLIGNVVIPPAGAAASSTCPAPTFGRFMQRLLGGQLLLRRIGF